MCTNPAEKRMVENTFHVEHESGNEYIGDFAQRVKNSRNKLGGSQGTPTPAPSPTEVGSLGGSTAVDRKNKKGISSMTTSSTILGSSKGG
ncbi:MAG: hypothetical protein ACRC17_11910 [Culicoidibacterales bacterium]